MPELSPQDAQRRFQLVLRRFIGVLARPEHPLALFLDDLQWLDAATLDLLEDLLSGADLQHLMLIGAYRDNEVTAAHPLMRKLEAIRAAGGKVENIVLAPLAEEHLAQLIADALRCEPAHAAPLAQLVHEKTGGNPFFAIQFLSSLADTGMLAFDHDTACWRWDLARIHAKGYTDNVVDLMVAKLNRLPPETQIALQQLACLGNSAETTTLAIVLGMSEAQVHAALWPAGRQEMVERLASTCRFVHDRVQEAAYSLIEEELRGEMHLRIGRLLAEQTPAEKREEVIFEIVNHLNRAIPLIVLQAERERLAEFNLIAGQRAKASTAYASALKYLVTGSALLGDDGWQRRRELLCALELNRAECEFLTGALTEADERLTALSARVVTTVERASVASLRVELYLTVDRSGQAVAVGLDYLRHLGVEWSPHPTEEEARGEYERIWTTLGDRPIEALVELPLMSDPASLVTFDVLVKLAVPALYTDANLFCLLICRLVNLSLEGGNSDGSCCAYEWLGGMIAGPRFGDYQTGFRFGRLGYDLVEQRGLERFKARIYVGFGSVVLPWTRHIRAGRDLVRRAFEAGNQSGDLTFAAHCCSHLNTNLLAVGDPLGEVQGEAERGLAFAQKMRFGLAIDRLGTQLGLIRTLRGLTPIFGCFDDAQFDERLIEQRFSDNPDLALAECWYWVRKLQARYFAGDYAAATEASLKAQRLLWTSPSHFETAEYHFYSALNHAACCDVVAAERQRHIEALVAHHQQIEIWAANCPDNFANRAALVGAEIARLEGRELDAERLYEQAIRSARDNGFVHHEALANELAARFYAARGFETICFAYLRNARYCYVCWGANAKVRQLDETHPRLKDELPAAGPTSTIGAPVEHLDLATVIKVSQAVSGEIILDKLIDTLMRTAMTQAGAERSLLLLPRGDALWIEAEATTRGDSVVVHLHAQPVDTAALPEPVLQYVLRTHENVIVGDASAETALCADSYVREHRARSVLCMPLLNQAKLIGVLYLENNLAAHVFAPARVAVLKLLASQAAIALENSRLYREAAERDGKIRRLVDANIIGIFVWRLEGETPEFSDAALYEVNDAFLRIMGYDREDFASGLVRRSNLTPPEWRDRTAQAHAELLATGTIQPYEKEYLRKDGTRVPVLVGIAAFEGGKEGVGFVLDLTERKQAEAKARDSERRYREVQAELAHANRATTMGQLTASIAHEIKQPIAASAANAAAAIHWLGAQPPNMPEAMQALNRIVNDAMRAGDIIGRIRDLIKKAPPRKDTLDVNEAVREVIELTRAEAVKHGVSMKAVLGESLPLVSGDRVQLQQVVLNMIVNAIEAMSATSGAPRDLLISTEADSSMGVLIGVSDSGPGLPPDGGERVFEPFYTTKVGGLGMGLSICRSIVDAHGGRLSAKPNVPRGAVFQFSLCAHPSTPFGIEDDPGTAVDALKRR